MTSVELVDRFYRSQWSAKTWPVSYTVHTDVMIASLVAMGVCEQHVITAMVWAWSKGKGTAVRMPYNPAGDMVEIFCVDAG